MSKLTRWPEGEYPCNSCEYQGDIDAAACCAECSAHPDEWVGYKRKEIK